MTGKEYEVNIIITSKGEGMNDEVDLHFGRAKKFLLIDTESGNCTPHDNRQNLNAAQGAGIQSAETALRLGAEAVITGNVGPKAFRVLNEAGVPVYLVPGECSVCQTLDRWKQNQLLRAGGATKEGHWA